MKQLLQPRVVVRSVSEIPPAIFMPTHSYARLPSCYQGTPLEIVQAMAKEMNPSFGVDDTIDTTLAMLREHGLPITGIPELAPEEVRATMFVVALLMWGVAHPMAQA